MTPSTIVVDNKGNITAVGSGTANVIVTTGDLKAACQIQADYYEAFFVFDWIYYFPSTEEYIDLTDTIEVAGQKCLLKSVDIIAPNQVDFGESIENGSDGLMLWTTAIFPFKVDNNGDSTMVADTDGSVIFTRRMQFVDDETELDKWTALSGSLDPEVIGPAFQEWLESKDTDNPLSAPWDVYESGVKGSFIAYTEVDATGSIGAYVPFYGFPVDGFIQLAIDEEGYGSMDYDFVIAWTGGYNSIGLATNWEAERWADLLIQPFATEFYYYQYKTGVLGQELLGNGGAPARKMALKQDSKLNKAAHKIVRSGKPVRLQLKPASK